MNYLVLGGAGFIGSHLVDALVAAGHRVRVFERRACELGNLAAVLDKIELCYGDFTKTKDLAGALEGIDLVVHLVSTVVPASSNLDPLYDIETNLKSTVSLLELALKKGVKKVVFASSGGTVYDPASALPIREESPTEPLSSYGIVKLATEKYLKLFHHLHGLDYTILRIANPYGERQRCSGAQGAVAVFLGRIKSGEAIEIWGDGTVARDYLYIADLTKALLLACEKSTSVKLFNLGSGKPCNLNQLIALLEEVSGRKVSVLYKESRACDSPVNYLDCRRAQKELGWEPQFDFREGLRRTWKWVSIE
ncbi:MAG: NAD-dependent epimerase/dehydratase family protein [Pseudomonadota bacterium]|nr:NAD-dependent epimerase/dehydratase family protein [Pseudomonadota bacterium]